MPNIYFVILNHPNENIYMPLEDDDGMAMFESEALAIVAGNKSMIGSEFGFEVFEIGGGVWG